MKSRCISCNTLCDLPNLKARQVQCDQCHRLQSARLQSERSGEPKWLPEQIIGAPSSTKDASWLTFANPEDAKRFTTGSYQERLLSDVGTPGNRTFVDGDKDGAAMIVTSVNRETGTITVEDVSRHVAPPMQGPEPFPWAEHPSWRK